MFSFAPQSIKFPLLHYALCLQWLPDLSKTASSVRWMLQSPNTLKEGAYTGRVAYLFLGRQGLLIG